MPKSTTQTATAPIKWQTALNLIKLLLSDRDYNNALLFACGFYCGLRLDDLRQLKWGQLDSESFLLLEGKTKKLRQLTVNPKLRQNVSFVREQLKHPPRDADYIFVSQRSRGDKTKPISKTAINKRIKKVFEHYGIETQNPSSHTLRKTFGRRVYEANGKSEDALIMLSKMFNHRDIATTRRYIGITAERIENIYLSM